MRSLCCRSRGPFSEASVGGPAPESPLRIDVRTHPRKGAWQRPSPQWWQSPQIAPKARLSKGAHALTRRRAHFLSARLRAYFHCDSALQFNGTGSVPFHSGARAKPAPVAVQTLEPLGHSLRRRYEGYGDGQDHRSRPSRTYKKLVTPPAGSLRRMLGASPIGRRCCPSCRRQHGGCANI